MKLTKEAEGFLWGEKQLFMKVKKASGPVEQKASKKRTGAGSGNAVNMHTADSLERTGLFEKLRQLRLEIAREEHMPPYIIFSDKTLVDMCARLPETKEEMLSVLGVGEVKYQKYGERFLEVLQRERE